MTLGYGFDDGPNCSHNAFYDYLSGQKQKASKFLLFLSAHFLHWDIDYHKFRSYVLHGSNVQNWPLEANVAWPMATKSASVS